MRNTLVRDGYCRNASELAAELHELAARLEGLGDAPISPVFLVVDLLAVDHQGTPQSRAGTVDILSDAIGLPPGVTEQQFDGIRSHVSSGTAGRVAVTVSTRVSGG